MRPALRHDPDVVRIADWLGMPADEVVGKLLRTWGWFSESSVDGWVPGISPEWLDRYVECAGWSSALQAVNWLQVVDGDVDAPPSTSPSTQASTGGLRLPAFEEWISESAKARLRKSRRQRRWRGQKEGSVDGRVDGGASTRASTTGQDRRGENRREQKGPPLDPPHKRGGGARARGGVLRGRKLLDAALAWPMPPELGEGFRPTWARWVNSLRGQTRIPTASALEGHLPKLAGIGAEAATRAIDYCVDHSCTGFSPKVLEIAAEGTRSESALTPEELRQLGFET